MAPAYFNATTGQTVVSDEPRPDLEALARWEEVPVPEPAPVAEPDPAQPQGVDDNTPPSDPAEPGVIEGDAAGEPVEIVGEPVADDDPAAPPIGEGDVPAQVVPDESWTVAQLDELAKERGIDFPTGANKAAKLAALTTTPAE